LEHGIGSKNFSNSVIIDPKNYGSLKLNEKTEFTNAIIDDGTFVDYVSNSTKSTPNKIANKNELRMKLTERNIPRETLRNYDINYLIKHSSLKN
jgi:hypothetical protein